MEDVIYYECGHEYNGCPLCPECLAPVRFDSVKPDVIVIEPMVAEGI